MDRDKALIYRLLDTEARALDELPQDHHQPVTAGLPNFTNRTNQDTTAGLSESVQLELSPFLEKESSYDILIDCLVAPAIDNEEKDNGDHEHDTTAAQQNHQPKYIKRSFRVMSLLVKDAAIADAATLPNNSRRKELVLNPTRAGLLAKKIYAAYKNHLETVNKRKITNNDNDGRILPHLPHLNKTLVSILHAYPSSVVGATCAGGKDGLESSFTPMLQLHQSPVHDQFDHISSPLSTMVDIVLTGCTGRKRSSNNNMQQQQMLGTGDNSIYISKGHRRKFVHSLSEWGLFNRLIDHITNNNVAGCQEDGKENGYTAQIQEFTFIAENICDTLLEIVNTLSAPPEQANQGIDANNNTNRENANKSSVIEDSVGEEVLISTLASDDIIQLLVDNASAQDSCVANPMCVSSRAISGLFEIATGKTQKRSAPPSTDAAEEEVPVEAKAKDSDDKENVPLSQSNKLIKSGFTGTLHKTLASKVEFIIRALDLEVCRGKRASPSGECESMSEDRSNTTAVPHPGRYIIKRPFTSRRLHLLTLLADVICYEDCELQSLKDRRAYASAVLDTLMKLPLDMDGEETDKSIILNPWPALCDLLFEYSENSMYQYQFYRLLHALCMINHEDTLKLVVQKCKFMSRAIKACTVDNLSLISARGTLLRCLNVLRLHSQSSSPQSFLRHYLESHDGWKSFQEELIKITKEQAGGLKVVNSNSAISDSSLDINLGSQFAMELGFPPTITTYVEENKEEAPTSSPKKKKKKKSKKKAKK